MNTHKFTGNMADQVEADRDELIKLRQENERLRGEVDGWKHWKLQREIDETLIRRLNRLVEELQITKSSLEAHNKALVEARTRIKELEAKLGH